MPLQLLCVPLVLLSLWLLVITHARATGPAYFTPCAAAAAAAATAAAAAAAVNKHCSHRVCW
jgi:hypothetical protein